MNGPSLNGIVDGIDVNDIQAAVLGCPGVAGLGSGTIGELATYLPGRRLPGIRVTPELVELEICAAWGPSAKLIAGQIWAALAAVVTDRPIEIVITDIAPPEMTPTAIAPPAMTPTAVSPTAIASGIESP
jgi:hypothetical protein